jgi:uncharacterized protein (TIGR03437 family)
MPSMTWRPAVLLLCLAALLPAQQTQSWTSRDKLALTYYFFWYNVHTGAGFHNSDGSDALTLHPPDDYLGTYAWNDVAFHQRELSDMAAAGIDVALAVYWGDAGSSSAWGLPGLKAMSQAAAALAQAGKPAPKIGMFSDMTSIEVANNGAPVDLTSTAGKQLWYGHIRAFFTALDRNSWALIDGRPIVSTYSPMPWASAWNQSTFDYVAQQFQQDFGVTPYFIRHAGFDGVKTDAAYTGWRVGAGPSFFGDAAGISPGWDNYGARKLPQEQGFSVIDRNCGDTYQRRWNEVVAHGARLVLIETWNELYEGEGISATKEYGRRYIDQTARNVAAWKSSQATAAAAPSTLWLHPGAQMYESGLHVALNFPDGAWRTTRIAGRDALYAYTDPQATTSSYYIYVDVDDRFLASTPAGVYLTVEYLDLGSAPWWIDYDGAKNAYTQTARVTPQNTGAWKQQTFFLPDAIFHKREAGGVGDLRIDDYNSQGIRHYFGRMWLSTTAPSGAPPQMPLVGDVAVSPGAAVIVPLTASDSSGAPLAAALATAPPFATLQGAPGAQSLRLAPTPADMRSCADGTGPNVGSSPYYVVTATTIDPKSQLSTDAASFTVSVTTTPTLSVNPPALNFTRNQLSGPLSLPFAMTASDGSSFGYTMTLSTESGANWLSVVLGPAGPAGAKNLLATVDSRSLAPGVYLGSIVVTAPALANSPFTLPVTLTVQAVPYTSVSGSKLSFTTTAGIDPAAQTLTISNSGSAGTVLNWTAAATTPDGGNWLSISPRSGSLAAGSATARIQVAVSGAGLAAGTYDGSIAITAPGAPDSPLTVTVTLTVAPAVSSTAPVITGVVNGANFIAPISAGSWVTIQGARLSSTSRTWTGADFDGNNLPKQLDGVSVTVDGLPAYVYFISPGQLNVLAPDDTALARVPVVVTNAQGVSNTFLVTKNLETPALFTLDGIHPAAVHLNGTLVGAPGSIPGLTLTPAIPGETIQLFGTGFGPSNPSAPAGQILAAPVALAERVTVGIAAKSAAVTFAGLTTNGLVQLNVVVPADLPPGDALISVSTGNGATQAGLILAVGPAAP